MKLLAEAIGRCIGFCLGVKLGTTLIKTWPPYGVLALYALVFGIMVWHGHKKDLFRRAAVAIGGWRIWQRQQFLRVKFFLAARKKADGNSDRK
jgi:hypothetical protein